ncbi:uncharacterized protein METZ01_LOCUS517066, partial [marine metagenome]
HSRRAGAPRPVRNPPRPSKRGLHAAGDRDPHHGSAPRTHRPSQGGQGLGPHPRQEQAPPDRPRQGPGDDHQEERDHGGGAVPVAQARRRHARPHAGREQGRRLGRVLRERQGALHVEPRRGVPDGDGPRRHPRVLREGRPQAREDLPGLALLDHAAPPRKRGGLPGRHDNPLQGQAAEAGVYKRLPRAAWDDAWLHRPHDRERLHDGRGVGKVHANSDQIDERGTGGG